MTPANCSGGIGAVKHSPSDFIRKEDSLKPTFWDAKRKFECCKLFSKQMIKVISGKSHLFFPEERRCHL
jgi:hypothetical protein